MHQALLTVRETCTYRGARFKLAFQCGGAVQSLAQIDQRYGRPARDAICAASTAQVFIPPLADPTTTRYLSELLGDEQTVTLSGQTGRVTETLPNGRPGPPPWLRTVGRGHAILVYRDLPPPRSVPRVGGIITNSPNMSD